VNLDDFEMAQQLREAVGMVLDEFLRNAPPILNRKAGALYRELAEREFGQIRAERASLPDENVTRVVVPLRGLDEDRELDEALERVAAIHAEVERRAPELVGRIVFDYSSDARRA
jgi:hypothetical protein